jgi:hypothetical protein
MTSLDTNMRFEQVSHGYIDAKSPEWAIPRTIQDSEREKMHQVDLGTPMKYKLAPVTDIFWGAVICTHNWLEPKAVPTQDESNDTVAIPVT